MVRTKQSSGMTRHIKLTHNAFQFNGSNHSVWGGCQFAKNSRLKRLRRGFERSRGDDAAERGAPSSETDGYSTRLLLNRPLNG